MKLLLNVSSCLIGCVLFDPRADVNVQKYRRSRSRECVIALRPTDSLARHRCA
jgi:hypothetical protein